MPTVRPVCQVRTERYDLAKEDVMPYFSLDRMTEAVFDCANQLFGLKVD